MIRHIKSLAGDESGASLIEMGLMLPVLGSLLIGFIDISRAYSSKLQLEQAAYRAVEKVQQYNTSSSTYNTLKTEAAAAANSSGFSGVTDNDVTLDANEQLGPAIRSMSTGSAKVMTMRRVT